MASQTPTLIETDIVQGDIRFRESDHSYVHIPTKKKLTSVTQVIRVIYALKSYDGVDPAVLENARIRGSKVDAYMAEYIRTGSVTLDRFESRDVAERMVSAHRVWEEEFSGLPAESQKIVYSLGDGIAGTMDFYIDNRIVVDLKCTYNIEKDWILQLGAYASMVPTVPDRIGIIHANKDGGTWMEYNVEGCMRYWHKAVEWWKETNGMAKEVQVQSKAY